MTGGGGISLNLQGNTQPTSICQQAVREQCVVCGSQQYTHIELLCIHYFSVCLMTEVLTLLFPLEMLFFFFFFFTLLLIFSLPTPKALPSSQYNKAFFFSFIYALEFTALQIHELSVIINGLKESEETLINHSQKCSAERRKILTAGRVH